MRHGSFAYIDMLASPDAVAGVHIDSADRSGHGRHSVRTWVNRSPAPSFTAKAMSSGR